MLLLRKDNIMWIVQYKSNNESQPWHTMDSYDNKTSAFIYAARVSKQYPIVKVTDPDGSVVWVN